MQKLKDDTSASSCGESHEGSEEDPLAAASDHSRPDPRELTMLRMSDTSQEIPEIQEVPDKAKGRKEETPMKQKAMKMIVHQ